MAQDGEAPRSQLARAAPRRSSSVRELVGSDAAMACVIGFVGDVRVLWLGHSCYFVEEDEGDSLEPWSLKAVLGMARLLPGVSMMNLVELGPAGIDLLLGGDSCPSGLSLTGSCSWSHVFGGIKEMRTLQKLRLDEAWLEEADFLGPSLALRSKRSLITELTLKHTVIGRNGGLLLSAAIASTQLRAFRVYFEVDCGPTSENGSAELARALAANRTLEELAFCNFAESSAARDLAQMIYHNTALVKLDLCNHGGDEEFDFGSVLSAILDGNSALRELNLSGCTLCQHELFLLAQVVRGSPTLRVLDASIVSYAHPNFFELAFGRTCGLEALVLRRCLKTSSIWVALGLALAGPLSIVLQELDLTANSRPTFAGMRVLSGFLKSTQALRILRTDCGNMRVKEGALLAAALGENRSIKELYFTHTDLCGLKGTHWPTLFAALATNAHLRTLRISSCGLSMADVTTLAQALTTNTSLRRLELVKNGIGRVGGCALASALAVNTTLCHLNLRRNSIGPSAAFALAKVLTTTNRTLAELLLFHNPRISRRAWDALDEARKGASHLTVELPARPPRPRIDFEPVP